MHLPGYHKINLVGLNVKFLKIDGVGTGAFGKKHQVIKGMPVRGAQVFMMFKIGCKATDQYIIGPVWRKGADIVDGYNLFHTTILRTLSPFQWYFQLLLWYFSTIY